MYTKHQPQWQHKEARIQQLYILTAADTDPHLFGSMAALNCQFAGLRDVFNGSVIQHHSLRQFPSLRVALCKVEGPVRSKREALGDNLLLLFEVLGETRQVFEVTGVLQRSGQVNTVRA